MSTITREQLHERAREKVKSLEFAVTQTAFADSRAELEEELELARIALASLEAEAVGEVIEQQSGMMMDGLVISEKPTYRNIKGIHKMKMMPLGTKFYTAPPAPANAEPVAWLWSHRKHPREVTLVRPEDDEKAEAALWSGWSCQALYAAPPAPVTVPDYPETLPCPVMLEPGLRFGKGVKTHLVLEALKRRAEYYAELEAMTPEQQAEHETRIKECTAMLQGKK